MRKIVFTCFFTFFFSSYLQAQTEKNFKIVPFKTVFHEFGRNTVHSLTYNNGLNVAGGVVGTYALVKTGFDWEWNRMATNNNKIAYSGMPSVIIGGLVPLLLPAGMYIYGRKKEDYRLQVTALALGQAALLGFGISSSIKAFTGRRAPEILDDGPIDNNDYSEDFRFGFWRRGAFDGWPSGHTMTAFAMGTCLWKLYPDNNWVKYGSFAYAGFIGLGISLNIHWFSDFYAGALIGYAIGSTVGESFKKLLDSDEAASKVTFIISPYKTGVCYNF